MATRFKATAVFTLIVGVQMFDCAHTTRIVCSFFNNEPLYADVLNVGLAADAHSSTMNLHWNSQSTFIPPTKEAPKSTQGSGTR